MKRVLIAFYSVLTVVLLLSTVFLYNKQNNQSMAMNTNTYGMFALANSDLRNANIMLNKRTGDHQIDAIGDISTACGLILAIKNPMNSLGIGHLTGIVLQLQEATKIISHPGQYTKSEVLDSKAFVRLVSVKFDASLKDDGNFDKEKLIRAISDIYASLPVSVRQDLYQTN